MPFIIFEICILMIMNMLYVSFNDSKRFRSFVLKDFV